MERMDRPRLIGGLLWTAAGLALAAIGALTGSPPGIVTALITTATIVTAAMTTTNWRVARWWTARALAVLIGLELVASVADRFGLLGEPGDPGVSWGSWTPFVSYTEDLLPPFAEAASAPAAIAATGAEVLLGVLLIAGPWWRWVGKLTAGMLFCYLVAMAPTVGLGEVARYGVAIQIGAALLISARGTRPSRIATEDGRDQRVDQQPRGHESVTKCAGGPPKRVCGHLASCRRSPNWLG